MVVAGFSSSLERRLTSGLVVLSVESPLGLRALLRNKAEASTVTGVVVVGKGLKQANKHLSKGQTSRKARNIFNLSFEF